MKIDILSDTHFDSWFGYKNTLSQDQIIQFWRNLNPEGEYLILAGDIGHSVEQNVKILKILKDFFYKEIILVLGNHDYYLIGNEYTTTFHQGGIQKAHAAKKAYQNNGFIVLDGTTVTLEGITFGGAMGWYNSAYTRINLHELKAMDPLHSNFSGDIEAYLQDLWTESLNDKRYTKLTYFDELYKEEYSKLVKIHKNCDVVISHYNPSVEISNQTKEWSKNATTSFFCFDGSDLIKGMSAKLWIYGHNHAKHQYTLYGKDIITNALGYYNELKESKILSITI